MIPRMMMDYMELTDEETRTQAEAIEYIQSHKAELLDRFVLSKNPLPLGFITIFMAGSPGAGKTEFSERYIPLLPDSLPKEAIEDLRKINIDSSLFDTLIIRIDVDEIRTFLPQYVKSDPASGIKGNAHVIQKAASKGLDILRNHCLKNDISFLHDGTFGNYSTMHEIISKSIKDGREVQIYYLYLDPLVAWAFTQAREKLEGRNIMKERFIEQYVKSKENVDRAKLDFGESVKIHCVLKDSDNKIADVALNWPSVRQYLETKQREGFIKIYDARELQELLQPFD